MKGIASALKIEIRHGIFVELSAVTFVAYGYKDVSVFVNERERKKCFKLLGMAALLKCPNSVFWHLSTTSPTK